MTNQPLRIEADEGEVTISLKLPRKGSAIETVSRVATGLARLNDRPAAVPGVILLHCPKLNLRHTANFAQVHWCGEVFTFTGYQRKMAGALVVAMMEGAEFLDSETLNAEAERDSGPIWKVFEKHPAWGLGSVSVWFELWQKAG